MVDTLSQNMSRQDILRRTGHISQVAHARPFEFTSGKGTGCKAIGVVTGGGLEFTVLQDRCLDVLDLRYKGVNLSFIAKPGVTSPQFFVPHDQFRYYFNGGFLYTCGLRNVGTSTNENGEEHPMHGRIGAIPAENVGISTRWQENQYVISISGEMREASLFGENLVLSRRIETQMGSKRIEIFDRLTNENCRPEEIMLLYHMNFGFPFLGPDLRLMLPSSTETSPRDEDAAQGMKDYKVFTDPIDGYREQCFYHTLGSDSDGNTCALLYNQSLNIAVSLRYNVNQLPTMTQWKCMASGDYALGIEPANCHVGGRTAERERGSLKSLAGFESMNIKLDITVLEGDEIPLFLQTCGLRLE
ncbi:MAG: aldose 1-epimerase family protein [Clostridiaceae bacterium]|jgi:hypothetical protein|nr:aldose 1-epimerase family protein [Clostridiaceae bacterium]